MANLGDPCRTRNFVRTDSEGRMLDDGNGSNYARINAVKDYQTVGQEVDALRAELQTCRDDAEAVAGAIARFQASPSRRADSRVAELVAQGFSLVPQSAPRAASAGTGRRGRPRKDATTNS